MPKQDWVDKVQEQYQKEQEGKPPEEPRWHPEPPEACEWPLRACPNVQLPCNQCPYHQEQF